MYVDHKIKQSGHIEVCEKKDEVLHRYVIHPNQPVDKYIDKIHDDPDFDKYRTKENVDKFIEAVNTPIINEDERIERDRINMNTEKWRLEIVLEEDRLLDAVNQMVSQTDARTQTAWNKAPSINRYSNALEGIRQGLELTHEQVDTIFQRANDIEI